MIECVGGILSFDVCGVSLGYIGLWTIGGAVSGVYLVADYGFSVTLASGLAGAVMGFFLGVITLPIVAVLVVAALFLLCMGAFVGACYFVFLASQQVNSVSMPLLRTIPVWFA